MRSNVVDLIRQKDKNAVVDIKWNDDTAGRSSITQEELKKINAIPQKGEVLRKTESWRQDLMHMIRQHIIINTCLQSIMPDINIM